MGGRLVEGEVAVGHAMDRFDALGRLDDPNLEEQVREVANAAELREALGSEMLVHFSIAARPAVTDEVRELAEDVGDDRALEQLAEGVPARADLVGRFSPHTRVREGDSIEVAVDERALHFFDHESGLAI